MGRRKSFVESVAKQCADEGGLLDLSAFQKFCHELVGDHDISSLWACLVMNHFNKTLLKHMKKVSSSSALFPFDLSLALSASALFTVHRLLKYISALLLLWLTQNIFVISIYVCIYRH